MSEENPVFKMFEALDNFDLRQLYKKLVHERLPDALRSEIFAQEKKISSGSQVKRLNRTDLLEAIYLALLPEIQRIDTAPIEDLPLLVNEEWPIPQLTERVKWRLANGVPTRSVVPTVRV